MQSYSQSFSSGITYMLLVITCRTGKILIYLQACFCLGWESISLSFPKK